MMKKKRRSWLIAIMVFFLLIIGLGVSIYVSYHCLTVREYSYSADGKISQDLKLVVLSDLHGHEFGEKNEKLIEKVIQQEPDLILLDGDFLNEDSEDSSVPVDLVRALCDIAPVYYALGNHEIAYMEDGHPELMQELS